MEPLDGRYPGLHPCSTATFVAVNGAKLPFPLCLQLAYSKSSGCIDDSLIPGPALLQDAAWKLGRGGMGPRWEAGDTHTHRPMTSA